MNDKVNIEYQKNRNYSSNVLKEYFKRYLIDIRKLKESSVRHYLDALNNISHRLKYKDLVKFDIYEINNLQRLLDVREILFSDQDFIELDKRGNRMYSSGINNYCKFASGIEFQENKENIFVLDIPIAIKKAKGDAWERSEIIRIQAIELAGYKCEMNKKHISFIAEQSKKQYMEGHHVIPIHFQSRFDNSLDIYANIICMCPICHRKIHYGLKEDRQIMMNQIYYQRANRLSNCGIKLSKLEFMELV